MRFKFSNQNFNQINFEQSKVEIMRSRNDEQSDLILFYKNRGDTNMHKAVQLEKLNQDLTEQKEQLEKDYESLSNRSGKKKLEQEEKIKELTEQLSNVEKQLIESNLSNEKKLDECKNALKKELNELKTEKNKEINNLNLDLNEKSNEIEGLNSFTF